MSDRPTVRCANPQCGEWLDPLLVRFGHTTHPSCGDTDPTTDLFADEPWPSPLDPDPFGIHEPVDPASEVTAMVQQAIVDYWHHHPRSLQTAIGPSEVGHPCKRHLAYKLLDWPKVSNGGDPLPPFIGTGAHLMMDKVYQFQNEKLGRERFIMSRELTIRPGLTGHGDCFDSDLGLVLDWKFPGAEPMREYRKGIIRDVYRVQLHAYGIGWENAGYKVNAVADVFMSRGGNLFGKYGACTIYEPYEPKMVLDCLDNLDAVLIAADALDVENNPDRWALIPATPVDCGWCPWFKPRSQNLAGGCPGDTPA